LCFNFYLSAWQQFLQNRIPAILVYLFYRKCILL
jgi:hypothetical protein